MDHDPVLAGIYYNTTNYHGAELQTRVAKASSQDQAILWYLKGHTNQAYTRDEIHVRVLPQAQNTSIGRALNTLMKAGYVVKLPYKRLGNMGARQHLWMFRDWTGD